MKEVWKDIKSYEGYYQVSNLGRVRSVNRIVIRGDGQREKRKGQLMKLRYSNSKKALEKNSNKRVSVILNKNGKKTCHLVHRLVAEAFIPNPENKETVNHIDGNTQNNSINNLEWATRSENVQHAYDNGLYPNITRRMIAVNADTKEFILTDTLTEMSERLEVSTAAIRVCARENMRLGKLHHKSAGHYLFYPDESNRKNDYWKEREQA